MKTLFLVKKNKIVIIFLSAISAIKSLVINILELLVSPIGISVIHTTSLLIFDVLELRNDFGESLIVWGVASLEEGTCVFVTHDVLVGRDSLSNLIGREEVLRSAAILWRCHKNVRLSQNRGHGIQILFTQTKFKRPYLRDIDILRFVEIVLKVDSMADRV